MDTIHVTIPLPVRPAHDSPTEYCHGVATTQAASPPPPALATPCQRHTNPNTPRAGAHRAVAAGGRGPRTRGAKHPAQRTAPAPRVRGRPPRRPASRAGRSPDPALRAGRLDRLWVQGSPWRGGFGGPALGPPTSPGRSPRAAPPPPTPTPPWATTPQLRGCAPPPAGSRKGLSEERTALARSEDGGKLARAVGWACRLRRGRGGRGGESRARWGPRPAPRAAGASFWRSQICAPQRASAASRARRRGPARPAPRLQRRAGPPRGRAWRAPRPPPAKRSEPRPPGNHRTSQPPQQIRPKGTLPCRGAGGGSGVCSLAAV